LCKHEIEWQFKMSKNKQITIKVIAEQAKVSATSVSRVLSGKATMYRISKRTEDEINRIAKKLDYKPNQLARALRLKRTGTIGMIIPDISNPFFSSIARCVEIESRKAGYSIMLCDSQEDSEKEKESIKILAMRQVDGIVICPVGKESENIVECEKLKLPVVMVDRYFPELKIPYVVSDNYNGAIIAVNHFCENGHRDIALIQGIPDSSVNKDRVRGYRDALVANNIPVKESFIVGDNFGEQNGYIGAKILLSGSDRPTAIFAASNLISLGAIRRIMEENLKIPDDISIIAFDDQPYFNYLSTPMTTISQNKEELGKISIRLLLNEINNLNNIDEKGFLVPTELIIRKSVKKLT
jgi:LacI family transcriptional regulator